MRQVSGDLWAYTADVYVITTNGSVRKDGGAVMGRGTAREAVALAPEIQAALGARLARYGNVPHVLPCDGPPIVSLPVKHQWWQKADLALIEKSVRLLVKLADRHREWDTIAMVRPCCGNGGLRWPPVRRLIEPLLDDRFVIVQR